jgi:hypothetical protein
MVLHQPLELEYWFVNVFSGSPDIFAIVAVLVLTMISAMFKMPSVVYMLLLLCFGALLAVTGQSGLLILLILILAPILFWTTRRMVD